MNKILPISLFLCFPALSALAFPGPCEYLKYKDSRVVVIDGVLSTQEVCPNEIAVQLGTWARPVCMHEIDQYDAEVASTPRAFFKALLEQGENQNPFCGIVESNSNNDPVQVIFLGWEHIPN